LVILIRPAEQAALEVTAKQPTRPSPNPVHRPRKSGRNANPPCRKSMAIEKKRNAPST
jgi:hypothetical protein